MPFTLLDVVLIVISLLSAVLAMMRGFSREVLSVLGWVCAAFAGIYVFFSPSLKAMTHEFITPAWLGDIVAVGGAFILTLLIISFLTVRISDMILDSSIGFLDRSLGFGFGLIRGILIVLMAYMLFSKLIPVEAQPEWISKARTHGLLQSWSDTLYSALPNNPAEQLRELKEKSRAAIESNAEKKENVTPPNADYKADDRKQLEQQIDKIAPTKRP